MPEEIECPYCTCSSIEGFDCIEHEDCGDVDITIDVYQCPKCGNVSKRRYKFIGWFDMKGYEIK